MSSLNLNENTVLFGNDVNFKSDKIFDMILVLAKFFIFRCKIKGSVPSFTIFHRFLKQRYDIEKYNARSNLEYVKFKLEWIAIQN